MANVIVRSGIVLLKYYSSFWMRFWDCYFAEYKYNTIFLFLHNIIGRHHIVRMEDRSGHECFRNIAKSTLQNSSHGNLSRNTVKWQVNASHVMSRYFKKVERYIHLCIGIISYVYSYNSNVAVISCLRHSHCNGYAVLLYFSIFRDSRVFSCLYLHTKTLIFTKFARSGRLELNLKLTRKWLRSFLCWLTYVQS